MLTPKLEKAVVRESFLPYALPMIGEAEIAEVVDSLRSGWITTGPKVRQFEADIAAYVGTKNAIAVNSCTAGLQVALTALGIEPGDEVLVPTMTFCATANVVVHHGATPILVDVGDDFNVTAELLETAVTPKTKAIMPVHYGGQSCDLYPIYEFASRHNLAVIEDAAHVIGATYQGYPIGADELQADYPELRRVTVYSFYATKNMTTGEGGMLTTANDDLAQEMRILTLHGMSRDAWKRYTKSGSWYYEVVAPGYKNNMTDIQAALGIHQLRQLDEFIATRQAYAQLYNEAFGAMPEIEIPNMHSNRSHVYHIYPIRLQLEQLTIDRATFIQELRVHNIGTSVHFIPVHLHPYYRDTFQYAPEDLPNATKIYKQLISLPLYPKMTKTDVQDVIANVEHVVATNRR